MSKNSGVKQISSVEIHNLGVISDFQCASLAKVNLIIGGNGSGKTFLLKALYSAIKTVEEYHRGDDIRTVKEILADKLRWTFQVDKIGDIVSKAASEPYSFSIHSGDKPSFSYRFSKDATTKIPTFNNSIDRSELNSIFIPAKEILSLYSIILKSREIDRSFGFDDTYYDLAKALRVAPTRGRKLTPFEQSRRRLATIIGGKIDFEETKNRWYYKNSKNQTFSIGGTAEGVKKIAILDRLFANGYLSNQSILFIDELESALHPSAISDVMEMLFHIAQNSDIQLFIASHSYFVIKKLCLLARANDEDVTCISMEKEHVKISNLREGMPENSIINESIRLYEEEVEQVL